MTIQIWPGQPYPLGATFDGSGTNFSLFSEVAERVELCLYDAEGRETRVDLTETTAFCWHGYLPGVVAGQRYGFRVHGPWSPDEGHRCNPAKLLLDPYAKAVEGQVRWDEAVFPYHFDDPEGPLNENDSAPFVPKAVVTATFFDWGADRPPRTPLHESVIYEVHVKGFTRRHPEIPEELRGTYAGLGHPVAVDYLKGLGVTAVELLPVHQFFHRKGLVDAGLSNYWGYDSIAYLAAHNAYSSSGELGQQVAEFKGMVKNLHEAGIEVILDVVYNHTMEGNHLGPMLSFKGIDNAAYYRLVPGDERHYMDYTGTGNSLNMRHPHVLQLIMDSLRYWVTEMHVDGFRFDLAATLARELHEVDRLATFFDVIQQDPVISQVKLIAEPWDVGEGGYQVGNFPTLWSEWNGKYRDTVRDYWRGADQTLAEMAFRLTGSSDLYAHNGRRPMASINFISAHDGFPLADLVSYNEKHNEANGEDNQDGEQHNRSWNHGVEGPTDDPQVLALRRRSQRNLLATLFLSQGVPMLLGGDEIGRSQGGNNNAYCQDNEISWFDWEQHDEALLEFTRRLIELRKEHPVFRRRRWFLGRSIRGEVQDLGWFTPEGEEMAGHDWRKGYAKSLGVYLNGDGIASLDERGQQIGDASFYLLMNAHHDELTFRVPEREDLAASWTRVLDTSAEEGFVKNGVITRGEPVKVAARSLVLLRGVEEEA
ncbi:MAG TPA: glycogen debranching protein GlgX [Thermoanaerobaculia bacterium]|nr:glycogen debranching protein GlgX [Thermoanaerobaculia bacterium]